MKRIMPFWFWPRHWGLKGTAKTIAEIEYYYTGYEADVRKIELSQVLKYDHDLAFNEINFKYAKIDECTYDFEINEINYKHSKIKELEYKKNDLKLKLKHNLISQREYEESLLEYIENDKEREIEALKFALRHNEITQNEYDKTYADIEGLPWFNFDAYYDNDTNEIVMTFDYNQVFWVKLKKEGHPGDNEQEIIDNYIRDWGRKLSTDEVEEPSYYENRNSELLYSNENGIKVYR